MSMLLVPMRGVDTTQAVRPEPAENLAVASVALDTLGASAGCVTSRQPRHSLAGRLVDAKRAAVPRQQERQAAGIHTRRFVAMQRAVQL